jgi:hypothetical protein
MRHAFHVCYNSGAVAHRAGAFTIGHNFTAPSKWHDKGDFLREMAYVNGMRPSIAMNANRAAIHEIVRRHRASNPRVFGSVARSEDTKASDLDNRIAACT